MIKTTLAPNAPWPYNQPEVVKAKPAPKARSKPEATDAKFEAWLKSITPVKGKK